MHLGLTLITRGTQKQGRKAFIPVIDFLAREFYRNRQFKGACILFFWWKICALPTFDDAMSYFCV